MSGQAVWMSSRGAGCRKRSDRSWAEGIPTCAKGGALSLDYGADAKKQALIS